MYQNKLKEFMEVIAIRYYGIGCRKLIHIIPEVAAWDGTIQESSFTVSYSGVLLNGMG